MKASSQECCFSSQANTYVNPTRIASEVVSRYSRLIEKIKGKVQVNAPSRLPLKAPGLQ